MTSSSLRPCKYSADAPLLPPVPGSHAGNGDGSDAADAAGQAGGAGSAAVEDAAWLDAAADALGEGEKGPAKAAAEGDGSVKLGHGRAGEMEGRVILPRYGIWDISFSVSKEDEWCMEQGSEMDKVVVFIGANAQSMKRVGEYYNRRAPGQRSIRYLINHRLASSSVAFRFEFKSDAEDATHHMVVTCGGYVQAEMPPMEVMEGGKRVCSEYVQKLRLEAAMGKARATNLLEELISATQSRAPLWDSSAWNHG